jgi:lipopolysaccharide/colanic/teichoic acid biosynthesis glycosyltransferase
MDNDRGAWSAPKMTYSFFKRLTDVVVSLCAIIALAPVMIAVAVVVKCSSDGPVFYRGERVGRFGQTFRMLKFRSMVWNADAVGGFSTALDDPRLTKPGRFLREYKLDELPQFINVLLGDMSLVGPRPQVRYYTDRYKGHELEILSVRPGITDLATLHFHDMDSVLGVGDVDSRYQTDVEPVKNLMRIRYVRNRSYLLDLRILIETASQVFGLFNITRLGVSRRGSCE